MMAWRPNLIRSPAGIVVFPFVPNCGLHQRPLSRVSEALGCSLASGQVGFVSKRSTIEERLTKLSKLREVPRSPRGEELQRALLDKVNLVAAKAAQIAGDLRESEIVPHLIEAFDRFMVNPNQTERLHCQDKDHESLGNARM